MPAAAPNTVVTAGMMATIRRLTIRKPIASGPAIDQPTVMHMPNPIPAHIAPWPTVMPCTRTKNEVIQTGHRIADPITRV